VHVVDADETLDLLAFASDPTSTSSSIPSTSRGRIEPPDCSHPTVRHSPARTGAI
jgi:hypothetical protein